MSRKTPEKEKRTAEKSEFTFVPVSKNFPCPETQSEARQKLGLPLENTIVLVSVEDIEKDMALTVVKALSMYLKEICIFAARGRDDGLKRALSWSRAVKKNRNVSILDSLKDGDMARMMRAADLFIGRPDSETVSKILLSSLPMIIYSHFPAAQVEHENVRLLLKENAAIVAYSIPELIDCIGRLSGDSQEYDSIVKGMAGLVGRGSGI